ncbi:hypothetical protein [Mucilaginibacter pedocola]|nr:hypothetical protein [Mucilaginibacter pedocola]
MRSIILLAPDLCSPDQLRKFHTLVLSGDQVQEEGLEGRIKRAAILGFA